MSVSAPLAAIRAQHPLLHCISNIVSANDCANLALAIGASPIMAQAPQEMADIAALAGAVVLNTGTPDEAKFTAARTAGATANRRSIPVVLDPVGVGASPWRLANIQSLLQQVQPAIVRVNAGEEALRVLRNDSFEGKTVVISGSGNVATYAAQKAEQLGAKVVTVSDSNGYIYDPNGINVEVVKQIKEVERGRIKEYAERVPGSEYHEGSKGVWTVKGDIALPCATQNEVDGESAQKLVDNGVTVVVEGANMPSTPEAIEVYQKNGVLYGPAKAANAGGVAVSGLEMSQNSYRLSWTFEEVDAKLKSIMEEIVANSLAAAKEYGHEGDLMLGANAAGFVKVANAMVAQGVL